MLEFQRKAIADVQIHLERVRTALVSLVDGGFETLETIRFGPLLDSS